MNFMAGFERISPQQAAQIRQQAKANVVDIRDPQSFTAGHIRGAHALNNDNLAAYIESADKGSPLIVCCYHGNSSQSAAHYLSEQGFTEVYSLDGGFEQWRLDFPHDCDTED